MGKKGGPSQEKESSDPLSRMLFNGQAALNILLLLSGILATSTVNITSEVTIKFHVHLQMCLSPTIHETNVTSITPTLHYGSSEGNKHVSFGNEAYGFEEDGHTHRCVQARGFLSAYRQPTHEVINSEGKKEIVTCPPMVAILKSATPEFYLSKNLPAEWAGKVTVEDSKLLVHKDFGNAISTS